MNPLLDLARECGATITPFPQLGAGVFDASMTESQLTAFAERIKADERDKCAALRENTKVAWRVMCDAEAVIRTIDPESAAEGEKLRQLCKALTDCAMALFALLRKPTQEWAHAAGVREGKAP